jgi:glycosyltransferase involved in cell wall biosynthesis
MSLKILLLSHKFHPDVGGIEVNSEIYARAFSAAGHEVRVLTWTVAAPSEDKNYPFTVVRNPNTRILFQQHAWAEIVFENNPCMRLAWPGVFYGCPSVISLNTALYWQEGVNWLKRGWLQRAKSVISVSEAVRKQSWPAAHVIGNPYRADQFKIFSDIPHTNDFVFLGRLVSQKGTALAIEAFHLFLGMLDERQFLGDKPSLTIIGDGPERDNLEQLVVRLGVSAHVRFVGFLHGETLARELNRYRYLLVPSLFGEAFGNVVLEGIACGCLPIVSDSDGLPDAAGKAGLVFKRGNAQSLADTIWEILHNPMLELELRQAAPDHLLAHQPEVVSQRYLRIIESAAAVKPTTVRSEGEKITV